MTITDTPAPEAAPVLSIRPRSKRTAVPAVAQASASSALDTLTTPAPTASARSFLATTELHAHPANPAHRSDSDFEELAEQIRADGEITEALIVRPSPTAPGQYEVLSGHRRLAAARLLGMALVPVRVRDLDDAAALMTVLGANQGRRDFTQVEEARLVQATLDLPGMTQTRLAEGLGKSRSWVSARAHAARTPATILDAVADRNPTFDDLDTLAEFEGTKDLPGLLEAFGTKDYGFRLQWARNAREVAGREQALLAVLKEAGVRRSKNTRPAGFKEAEQFTDRTSKAPERLAELLTELGADKTWRYVESYYLYLYRPLTEKELAAEAKKTEKQKAKDEIRRARDEQLQALHEPVQVARGVRAAFLREAIATRKLTPAQTTVVLDYFTAMAATDAVTGSSIYLNSYCIHALVPATDAVTGSSIYLNSYCIHALVPATKDREAWVAKLTPASRLLILAALYGEDAAKHPREWLDKPGPIRAYYNVLTTLGYTPSTAELTALAAGDSVEGEVA